METNITTYKSDLFGQIRTATDQNGNPLFCYKDVINCLGLSENRHLKKKLNQRGVTTNHTPTYNQHGAVVDQQMTFINEPNLYRLIFQSRKATAEQFQNWVFEEVLPSIRKTGGYNYEKEIKQLQQENQNLQIKLDTIEKRITNHKHNGHLTSTTKLAKMYGIEIGELIKQLDREDFIIYWANMMVITPMSENNEYAEYVTWYKGNRKIEYVGWTDKGICAIVQELKLSESKPNPK